MPYFISDTAEGCDGWATVKDDGEVMGCHMTKQDAIDQGLAIALAEDSTFEGERNLEEILEDAPGGGLPENYRPATSDDVPEGRACGNCIFFNEERLNDEGEAWCEWWEAYVRGGNYCNAWQGKESRPYHDDDEEERQPAPPEEQIVGSDKNEPGSASGPGGDIELSEAAETGLRNKVKEHNDEMKENNRPSWTRATYGQLAAVYRRGAGAFSVSHRPGMTRGGWAMARVNAYLYLLANGEPKRKAYVQDNDLLPEDHPKSTRSLDEQREVNLTPPAYMRASARRGLEWHREGLSGDGLVDRTVTEARAMAEGNMTADKWTRTAAWIARHLVDMDAPQNMPGNDDYPGPGAVAMALWGGGGSKRSAQRALEYAEGVVDTIKQENEGRNVAGEAQAKLERRQFEAGGFEIREEGDGFRIEGYAALFNSRSENLGGFTETIERGAFRESLRSRGNVMFYYNHNSSQVLASTRAGTLRLEEDERGLKVTASVAPTSYGRDAKILVERGDVTGFSFGFSMPSDGSGDQWNAQGTERILKSVRLFEVSLVGSPAYSETNGTATVRGLDKVAERAHVDADALADALLKIENGEDITTDDRQLVDKVLAELSPAAEAPDDTYSTEMLALKKKKLQLLMGTP
jgi:HK97 family phage prohead protease